jgi:hypothetical protein
MKWITRARPKTDRIACPWLITRLIDPNAEIIYVPADTVLEHARRIGGKSFDAPGADYTHQPNPGGVNVAPSRRSSPNSTSRTTPR